MITSFTPICRIRFFSSKSASSLLDLRLKDVKTPDELKGVCQEASQDFSDKHWLAAAVALEVFSKQGMRSEILRIEEEINRDLAPVMHSSVSLSTMSHISWIYGKLGIANPLFMNARKNEIASKSFKDVKTDDITKLGWSIILMQDWDYDSLRRVAGAIESKVQESSALKEHELFRVVPLSLAGRVKWKRELLGNDTIEQVNALYERRRLMIPGGSGFQEEVSSAIIHMAPSEWKWEKEFFLEGYHLDLACPEEHLIFEIDGRSHFYPGTWEQIARDRAMDFLLEGLGWKVRRISSLEWNEADSSEKKEALISLKLQN